MFRCNKNLYNKNILEGSLGSNSFILLFDLYDKNIIPEINEYLLKVGVNKLLFINKDVFFDYTQKNLSGNLYGIVGNGCYRGLYSNLVKYEIISLLMVIGLIFKNKLYDKNIFPSKKDKLFSVFDNLNLTKLILIKININFVIIILLLVNKLK